MHLVASTWVGHAWINAAEVVLLAPTNAVQCPHAEVRQGASPQVITTSHHLYLGCHHAECQGVSVLGGTQQAFAAPQECILSQAGVQCCRPATVFCCCSCAELPVHLFAAMSFVGHCIGVGIAKLKAVDALLAAALVQVLLQC
jgi:hypothetical protein